MNPVIMGMMLVLDQMSKLAKLADAAEGTLSDLTARKPEDERTPQEKTLIEIMTVVRDFTAAAKAGDDVMARLDEEIREQMGSNVIGGPERFIKKGPSDCFCGNCD